MDLANMKARKGKQIHFPLIVHHGQSQIPTRTLFPTVADFTDKKIARLPPLQTVLASLHASNVPHVVYDRVRIEPTDGSFMDAIEFARKEDVDAFVAVGRGSVIDTAKAANLYLCHPGEEFLEFVNGGVFVAVVRVFFLGFRSFDLFFAFVLA